MRPSLPLFLVQSSFFFLFFLCLIFAKKKKLVNSVVTGIFIINHNLHQVKSGKPALPQEYKLGLQAAFKSEHVLLVAVHSLYSVLATAYHRKHICLLQTGLFP